MRRNRRILALIVCTVLVAVAVPLVLAALHHGGNQQAAARRRSAKAPRGADKGGDDTAGTLPPIAAAVSGPTKIVARGPASSQDVALTFDDGTCDQCVSGLVAGVERTGAHVTFCPNGVYGEATWDKYADRIKALIAKGEVSICNHTWDHKDLAKLSAQEIRTELTKNEKWIEKTFGVSSRPYFRPPFGNHNRIVDDIAAGLGYTQVLLWSGTLGDSIVHPPDFILGEMRRYAQPGVVILAHGNHPATASVFDDLVATAHDVGLSLVTVNELFRAA